MLIYELMAEYGYYGGMIPYISNQYQKTAQADGQILSNTYILGKIFEGKYVSIKEFKKAMFQKRADKLEQLKPIQLTYDGQIIEVSTVDQLKELMLDAVEYDLETVELTAYGWNNIRAEKTKVETLKKEVYTAYLNLTDDFRSSIYMDNTDSENTDSGTPDNGNADGGNTDSGNTNAGDTDTETSDNAQMQKPTVPSQNKDTSDILQPDGQKQKPWIFIDVDKVPGTWKYDNIQYVYQLDLMADVGGSKKFLPDQPLTRTMFATVLYRMAGEPAVKYIPKFSDVAEGKWYSNAILWASDKKIVEGYQDGSYGINRNITREQIAKMLYLYGETHQYNVSSKAELDSFTDKAKVSGWAIEFIQWAVDAGMISGKPNGDNTYRLDPKGEATRAECAKMLTMF